MKENKKAKKVVALLLCAVLLVVGSVTGTMAYLTSQDSVTNTFTVGKVAITLDEAKVDVYGVKDGDTRVKANEYKLIPGHTYVKDPIVHVDASSEDCWVFVKVENGISTYEDSSNLIAGQITSKGWTELSGVTNVYFQKCLKIDSDKNLEVFDEFKIAPDANTRLYWNDVTTTNTKINITAYAVQADGFGGADDAEKAKAAWDATFGA